ncbi:twin-arginine translocase TatA/TatE family subunit [Thiocystis violacea]|uniref:twin-arginine translocase TatA/TatE family subunit n=1 Tax=Thiocystis violacea TaxID=13725 RepID=UPI001907E353|nr:twin-arginine translocase TatA/TatE family subunit [Thiocystis violacea]MBK1721508.1 hypothetical protein [Thiocystis violacea]
MGISGISFWELMLILVGALLLFGSRRLPGMASDLGSAIRNIRRAIAADQPGAAAGTGAEGRPPREGASD